MGDRAKRVSVRFRKFLVGRAMALQTLPCILICGTREYGTLRGKKDFANVIKLRDLKRRQVPRQIQCKHKIE